MSAAGTDTRGDSSITIQGHNLGPDGSAGVVEYGPAETCSVHSKELCSHDEARHHHQTLSLKSARICSGLSELEASILELI